MRLLRRLLSLTKRRRVPVSSGGGGEYSPSLDFSDARNSMYTSVI